MVKRHRSHSPLLLSLPNQSPLFIHCRRNPEPGGIRISWGKQAICGLLFQKPVPEKPVKWPDSGLVKNLPDYRPDCPNTGGNALTGWPPKAFKQVSFRNVVYPILAPETRPECECEDHFFRRLVFPQSRGTRIVNLFKRILMRKNAGFFHHHLLKQTQYPESSCIRSYS